MHFVLADEQNLLQNTLGCSKDGQVSAASLRDSFDCGTGYDEKIGLSAAEIGLGGLIIPEEFGGAGLSIRDLTLNPLPEERAREASAGKDLVSHGASRRHLIGADRQSAKRRAKPNSSRRRKTKLVSLLPLRTPCASARPAD